MARKLKTYSLSYTMWQPCLMLDAPSEERFWIDISEHLNPTEPHGSHVATVEARIKLEAREIQTMQDKTTTPEIIQVPVYTIFRVYGTEGQELIDMNRKLRETVQIAKNVLLKACEERVQQVNPNNCICPSVSNVHVKVEICPYCPVPIQKTREEK